MSKDLLADRFGRFYEIPRVLAQSGHQVRGVCLKYWPTTLGATAARRCEFVEWCSFPLGRNWPLGFIKHYRRLEQISAKFKPDVIVGASDSAHVIMAAGLALKIGIPYAVDLYDNFESYRATNMPGMKHLLRRAIRNAVAVSVVSKTLLAKVERDYRPTGILEEITNAIAPEIFHPTDKGAARRSLGLPETGTLIGTAGSLTRARGIETLYHAFRQLTQTKKDLSLVLAGPTDLQWNSTHDNGIIYLGDLLHQRIGDLFNALNVGIICNRDDEFGRYCSPQKLFEMLACELPVVAADVGAIRDLLPGAERFLYAPEDVSSLANVISAQVEMRYRLTVSIPTWKDCALRFGNMLEAAASSHSFSQVEAARLRADEV